MSTSAIRIKLDFSKMKHRSTTIQEQRCLPPLLPASCPQLRLASVVAVARPTIAAQPVGRAAAMSWNRRKGEAEDCAGPASSRTFKSRTMCTFLGPFGPLGNKPWVTYYKMDGHPSWSCTCNCVDSTACLLAFHA